ncbi:MAG: alpha-L-arabinofuranosidase [Chloroflexi bacterium]|nr:alpha-L-arabinofuranosidase [Chloroflexota bacterium]
MCKFISLFSLLCGLIVLVACGGAPEVTAVPNPASAAPTSQPTSPPETAVPTPLPPPPVADGLTIELTDDFHPFDARLLGSNLPAWLGTGRVEDPAFINRTIASGVSLMRIPGGSWSNYYDWAACEIDNLCPWDWGVLRPTDFINFVRAAGVPAMYIVNPNGTPQEAAALVAFFNGAADDETVIGPDVRGRDWGTVGQWAQLRRDNGNPEPLSITYWEFGNEVYGGKEGTECLSWGWEDVWTCDGREYIQGLGSGAERQAGFLEFREAMRAVDRSIKVGAVGVPVQSDWSNWGNEVIEEAGAVMDFYIIHQYAYFEPPRSYEAALAQPQAVWQPMMADVQRAFDRYANGRRLPIAVTEYNLFSVQDQDNAQWMTRAVNMLFMADTIGQMATHGFSLANQWDLANGQAGNGTDYGLMNVDTLARSPQYYVFPLWARFGSRLLPVNSSFAADTTLSAYGGLMGDGRFSLLVINKTGEPITTDVAVNGGPPAFRSGLADVAVAPALDSQIVTFNGVSDPADDLSDAPSTPLAELSNPFSYTFPPYSITLLRLEP